MALHTTLPIYRDAYRLLNAIMDLAKNMSRDFRVLVGAELRDHSLKIMTLIFNANCASDQEKVPYIERLLERQQMIELLLRFSCDKKLISKGQYAKTIELTSSVGKQAIGWRRKYALSPAS